MRKFTKLFSVTLVALIVLAGFSCKKNNVKKIEVDNSFALSIFKDDSILMSDFLDMIDSTWRDSLFVVGEDGSLSVLVSNDTMYDMVTGRKILDNIPSHITIDTFDYVQIPDLEVPDSLLIVQKLFEDCQQYGLPVPQFTYNCKIDTLFDLGDVAQVSYHVDDFTLYEVAMKEGTMALGFEIENLDQLVAVTTELWTDHITNGSENINFILTNPGYDENDLGGYIIKPEDELMTFKAKVNIYMDKKINEESTLSEINDIINRIKNLTVDPKRISLYGAIEDAKVDYVRATINNLHERFGDTLSGIDFDVNNLTGDMWLHTPIIRLGYVNTFDFNINALIDTLDYKNNNDENISLLANTISMNITKTEEGQFNYFDISDGLVESMEMLGGVKEMYYSTDASISTSTPGLITEEPHIDLATNIEMPLKMKVNQLTYTDSFPVSLGESLKDVTNYLDEIELTFRAKNGLPLAIGMQIYTCDSTLTQTGQFITDSIFKADEYGVMHNVIGSNFGGGGAANSTVILSIKNDKTIQHLLNANKLMMELTLTTDGKMVTIKTTDVLGLGIGLKTKTSEINL